MSVIVWIIFGALAGWIALLLDEPNARQNAFGNVLTGILGAFLGGWFVQQIDRSSLSDFNMYSILVAIIGAALLLCLYRMAVRRNNAQES